jgi:hypothetical protein
MFASEFKTALLATILATSAAVAQAEVITFEGIADRNSYKTLSLATPLVPLAGYSISPIRSSSALVIDAGLYGSGTTYASNATDYLMMATSSSITLTSTSNLLFNVNSIDLAKFYGAGSNMASIANITGTFANGTKISKSHQSNTINLLTTNDFTTVMLSDFTNLKSLTIFTDNYQIGIDNIVVTQSAAVTDMPEPASLAILGLGLFGIGVARRRKSV